MALKRKITKEEYEKLADPLKTEYKAAGEDYVLDVEGIDDITNVESALRKTRDELKDVKDKLKAKDGVDPEKYAALVAKEEELEKKKLEQEGNYKALLAQVNEKHEAALKGKDAEISRWQNLAVGDKLDSAINSAIATHGAIPKVMHPLLKSRVAGSFNDAGEYVITVNGEDGKPLVDSKGVPMTVAGLVESMKADKDYGGLFSARPASGGGQPGDRRPSPPTPQVEGGPKRTSTQRIAEGLKQQEAGRR